MIFQEDIWVFDCLSSVISLLFFPKFYVPPGSSLIIYPCTPAICDRIFKYFSFLSFCTNYHFEIMHFYHDFLLS